MKGKKYRGDWENFGNVVLHRVSGKVVGGIMEARWNKGVYLGHTFGSGETIVGMSGGGVFRCRSWKPVGEIPSCDKGLVLGLTGTPWEPTHTLKHHQEKIVSKGEIEIKTRERNEMPYENFRIDKGLLEKYGFTEGCPKCRDIECRPTQRSYQEHSERCRQRISNAIRASGTANEKDRLHRHEERLNEYLAKEVEKGDDEKRTGDTEEKPEDGKRDGEIPIPEFDGEKAEDDNKAKNEVDESKGNEQEEEYRGEKRNGSDDEGTSVHHKRQRVLCITLESDSNARGARY